MRKPPSFVVCCLFLAASVALSQSPSSKDGWGPWRSTVYYREGIQFRSKCMSSSDTDSKWEYQFRSRYDRRTMDFVEQEEHGVPDTTRNELGEPQILTLDQGKV